MSLISLIWLKILKEWWRITVPIRLRSQGIEVGVGVRFYGMPVIGLTKGSRIRIGDRVVLCSDARFTALGVNHPVVLRTLRPDAIVNIGNDCGISGGSICAAVHIEIGNECLLGANVTITDTDFHAIQPTGRRYNKNSQDIAAKPVKIENNVFIGMGAIVLKGNIIGQNSVIGAGSIVTTNIPANTLAVGVPARVIDVVV